MMNKPLDKAPVGIIISDADMNITYFNKIASQYVQKGMLMDYITNKELKAALLRKKDFSDKKFTFVSEQKEVIFLCSAEFDDVITLVFYDVTANENAADVFAEDVEIADIVSDFIHDLKTPINAMNGAIEIMQEMPGFKTERYMRMLMNNCCRIKRIINNISDINSIKNKTTTLDIETFDLVKMINDLCEAISAYAGSNRVSLHVEGAEKVDFTGDYCKIERIMTNLISNAVKYSPKESDCSVTIGVTETEDMVVISVSDNGIGIPPERLDYIFGRGQRAVKYKNLYEGSGLGLAITKRLVELHEGTIEAQSVCGEGSVFTVKLPKNKNIATADEPRVHFRPELNTEFFDLFA